MQEMFEIVKNMPKEKCYDKGKYQKQKWRNALQEYCDTQSQEVGDITGYCVCGYMNYCDYCRGSGEPNACVKAICELAKEKGVKIDYNNFNFEKFLAELENK